MMHLLWWCIGGQRGTETALAPVVLAWEFALWLSPRSQGWHKFPFKNSTHPDTSGVGILQWVLSWGSPKCSFPWGDFFLLQVRPIAVVPPVAVCTAFLGISSVPRQLKELVQPSYFSGADNSFDELCYLPWKILASTLLFTESHRIWMSDLLLAVLRAASRSQQKSVQIPMFAQESPPARIMREAAGQAGGWQGCGGKPRPLALGVQALGTPVSRGDVVLAKPFLRRLVQVCFSQCIF